MLVDGRDGVDQLLAEVPARDQLERLAARLELPQPRGVGAEQLLRGVEDVLEHRVELERAVDLGHDPAKRDRARLLVSPQVDGSAARRAVASRSASWPAAPAVRRAVVQGERHATGRGYPLRAPCAPRGTGGDLGLCREATYASVARSAR